MSIDGILSETLPTHIANSMSGGLPDDESYSVNHFVVSSVRSGLGWALGLELTVLKLGFHETINNVMFVAPFNHGSIERRNLRSPSTLRTSSIKAWLLLPIPGTAVEMSKEAPLFT